MHELPTWPSEIPASRRPSIPVRCAKPTRALPTTADKLAASTMPVSIEALKAAGWTAPEGMTKISKLVAREIL